MSEIAYHDNAGVFDAERAPPKNKARTALMKRLADVVSLPESRVNAFERAVTADLLVEIFRDAEFEERLRVARRLAVLNDIPNCLVRLILRDEFDIAQPLLQDCLSLNDCDLLDCVRVATGAHRRLIAGRRGVSEVVCESLVEGGETLVVETLLKNELAKFSHAAIEAVVAMTRHQASLAPLLLRRPELRPSQAYVLFWWADAPIRRTILQRFAVSREILQEVTSDVFPMASAEGWQDALSRKALQFIERRQRNRAAVEKSPFSSLEEAIHAAEQGLTRPIADEIAYLAGLKPMTGAKILMDPGGEPLAILCKATGLGKSAVRSLWKATRRPETNEAGEIAPALDRVLQVFDMIAVDRAQTVLRYWNWALSSAMTPALLHAIREQDDSN
ncbi:MAG TPA: DUF2336 domain-containing protein, partial [Caulobacteraceae bacterium]|nr:DUF2336 domain-containing protein [Caulobacteraceae bacterium]